MPAFKKVKLNPTLSRIGGLAEGLKLKAYIVGGAVRDLLTGKKVLDWDIVVEGDTGRLVKAAATQLKGRVTAYPKFGTYCLQARNGSKLDFATARKETYSRAGALPTVAFSSLDNDLYRRDFTVNALAVRLNGGGAGEIIDLFGGKRDLKNRVLRILHGKSFKDDPTRLFRIARFAARGFRIDKLTEKYALASAGYISRVSAERLSREFLLIMGEADPLTALNILKRWGITDKLLPGVEIGPEPLKLSRIKKPEARLASLFSKTPKTSRSKIYAALRFPNKLKNSIEKLIEPRMPKPSLNGKDILKMGYKQGPAIGRILKALSSSGIGSRAAAKKYVFDNFPQKI